MLAPAPVAGQAGADQPPLADAGLDQQTEVESTVRLDATGSQDPAGQITSYEWEIEAPNGSTKSPACGSCGRTTFVPKWIGTYNVTVTVTDNDGQTRSDTLFVTVEPGKGPSVLLTGPEAPPTQMDVSYTAVVSAGDVALDRLRWRVNGSQVENQTRASLSPGNTSYSHRFESTANKTINVTVVDVAGQRATDTLTVEPRKLASVGGGSDRHTPPGIYIPDADSDDGGAWVTRAQSYQEALERAMPDPLENGNLDFCDDNSVNDDTIDQDVGVGEDFGMDDDPE